MICFALNHILCNTSNLLYICSSNHQWLNKKEMQHTETITNYRFNYFWLQNKIPIIISIHHIHMKISATKNTLWQKKNIYIFPWKTIFELFLTYDFVVFFYPKLAICSRSSSLYITSCSIVFNFHLQLIYVSNSVRLFYVCTITIFCCLFQWSMWYVSFFIIIYFCGAVIYHIQFL